MKIDREILKSLIRIELNSTDNLKQFKGIDEILVRQAEKESSLNLYSERYEAHLDDKSVGLYQLLTSTMKWLGFESNNVFECYFPEVQVEYALKYLDYLYSKFSEIHNKNERLKMTFASYNMGKGNVNKALKKGRQLEEIFYDGKDTLQGKWARYDTMIDLAEKYKIVSSKNADINRRYIKYIIES